MVAAARAMSKRTIKITSSQRLLKLKQIQLKKNTEAKCNWAIAAYIDWQNDRLKTNNYNYSVYMADITNLDQLDKACFKDALCMFIPEVTKRDGDLYPGPTLYQIIVAIQKHLNVNRIKWELVTGHYFLDVRTVLDNVMKERTALNLGVNKKQANLITYEMEQDLWNRNFLGEDSPEKLRLTVYFLVGLRLMFRSVQDHYNLRRDLPNNPSQFTFEMIDGVRCIHYREDHVTKTHDGGLSDMKHKRKEGIIYPGDNFDRDPVRLIEKYLGLCPQFYFAKPNFYLQTLRKPSPKQWYGAQVLGEKSMGKMLQELMNSAGYKGLFTGHSLRRSGGTRLFQAGVQRKLVKECTGHTSDAVDEYQITSNKQKEKISEILCAEPNQVTSVCDKNSMAQVRGDALDPDVFVKKSDNKSVEVDVKDSTCTCKSSNVGNLVDQIVSNVRSDGKTTIKIQIEITKE